MANVNDKAQTTDAVKAVLTRVPTAAVHPCPEPGCGAETRPHGEAPREESAERICSALNCREVQPAMDEVPRGGPGDGRARFPCRKCKRETKVFKAGRTGSVTKRICTKCRKVTDASN